MKGHGLVADMVFVLKKEKTMRIRTAVVTLVLTASFLTGCTDRAQQEIAKLMQDCESDNPGTRWRATAFLSTYNPAAIPVLTDALDSPKPNIRWCAAVALAKMAPDAPTALEKLKTMMSNDEDSSVRQAAQLAANRIGGEKVTSEPASIALSTSIESGSISLSCKPVRLFEMLDRQMKEPEQMKETEQMKKPGVMKKGKQENSPDKK